jgi:protein ImuA
MKQAEKLDNLRQLLAPRVGAFASLGVEACDRVLNGGIEAGVLHEIFAAEAGDAAPATSFALGLATRLAPGKPLFWVRQDFSALEQGEVCAAGLSAFGIDPAGLVSVRVHDARMGLRACGEILSCPGIGVVLFELTGQAPRLDLAASRRLLLAAQIHGVSVLLLRMNAAPEPSAATTRWRVRSCTGPSRFDVELIRNRHGGTGRWLMEWDNEQGLFRDTVSGKQRKYATHSSLVAAPSSDRPAQTTRAFVI